MTLLDRIAELETALVDARARVSQYERGREVVPQQLQGRVQRLEADLSWLRELRARRVAMGRVADDERNAPRDCDGVAEGWMRSCQLHPGPGLGDAGPFDAGASLRGRPPGWRPNPAFVPRPEPKTAQLVRMLSAAEHNWHGDGDGDGDPARVHGPRLRCGAFRLEDCSPAIQDGCDEICEAAEERFGFEP